MEALFGIDLDNEQSTPSSPKGGQGGGWVGDPLVGGGHRGGDAQYYGYDESLRSSVGINNGGYNGNMPFWGIITIAVAVTLALVGWVVAMCLWRFRCRKNESATTEIGHDDCGSGAHVRGTEFDQAVSKAREKQTTNSAYDPSPNVSGNASLKEAEPIFETYSGVFDVKYTDRGEELSRFVKIQLKNNGNGYKIKGYRSDADATAAIIDGFISFTGDGWWLDETYSGRDMGLKVLTEGKFHFRTGTFFGAWRDNNGALGRYTEFKGKDVSKTFRNDADDAMASSPQKSDATLEEDIRFVLGTARTPAPVAVAQALPDTAQTPLLSDPTPPPSPA